MKPLSLNLSRMKKISGDQKSSTFLHPSGHKMVIAHSGVSSLQKKQLEQLPVQNMAEGGPALPPELADIQQDQPPPVRTPSFAEGLGTDVREGAKDALGAFKSVGNAVLGPAGDFVKGLVGAPEASANAPETIQPEIQQPLSGPTDGKPPVPQDAAAIPQPNEVQGAYEQGQRGITEQQNVAAQQAKNNAEIQANDLAGRQAVTQNFQDLTKQFAEHQQQFMNDYMNNHVDPKHYLENMGAGQRVATGIGLLLGGIASGTQGSNPAMDMLNRQIDRDIAAQHARIDQQKTILGANQELYKDQAIAANQTRVNMNDIYDHKIQLAASQLGTPQAKAAADMAHAHFALQNAQLLQMNAVRGAVMQHLQSGGPGLNAIDLSHAGMIPQEEAIKEQSSIDAQKKALASASDIFDKYRKEQTAGNVLNPQSYKRADELNAQLTNLIMESDASKRLTPESARLEVKPFFVKTTDDNKTLNDKMSGIANLVRQHAAPTPYMSHYSPQSLPQYGQMSAHPLDGKTASDANGNRIVMKNGRWVPFGG